MASANVDLARAIWAGWERGDFSGAGWAHPEIEFFQADLPGSQKHVGIPEMGAAWREFLQAWEGFLARSEEFRELDEERVLVLGTFSGRGKGSGLDVGQVQMKGVMVFPIRDRKVTKLVTYFNRERGLTELGL